MGVLGAGPFPVLLFVDSAHVGASGLTLEPLARHWSHWPSIGAIGVAYYSEGSRGGKCLFSVMRLLFSAAEQAGNSSALLNMCTWNQSRFWTRTCKTSGIPSRAALRRAQRRGCEPLQGNLAHKTPTTPLGPP